MIGEGRGCPVGMVHEEVEVEGEGRRGGWDDMMRYDGMEGWSFLFVFV